MARRLLLLVGLAAMLPGCSTGVNVRQASQPSLFAAWQASVLDHGTLSQRTQQTLRRLDLADLYARDPHQAAARLHQIALQDEQTDYLFALAEIHYLFGQDAERAQHNDAVLHYYLCAGYAYHYLFHAHEDATPWWRVEQPAPGTDVPAGPNPFDPRHRLACDLYNAGLGKCLRVAQAATGLDPANWLHVPTPENGRVPLKVEHHGFAWKTREFGPVLFCSDFEVVGLNNRYCTFGLGVPLIGSRVASDPMNIGPEYYPREVTFPVTAFYRFDGDLADLRAARSGRLELYNPLRIQSVVIGRQAVALETDLTTPLAYFLSHSDLRDAGLTGFLRSDRLRGRTGIYLFEPYQPGKIPVVMTHGLLSSPLTWAPMFNDLRADPQLREHYQFWFYLYPTGEPYLAAAADLRRALQDIRLHLDPQGRDPALAHMVLVGHSMGGLVNKLVTLDSGDDFWRLLSPEPFAQIKGTPETKDELQRVFYFEREREVERVIFLGTPHHGSKLSPSPLGRLAEQFIRMPRDLVHAARDLVRENPEVYPGIDPDHATLPTSLDLLSPGAPALELLARRSPPQGVTYHTVAGVIFGEGESATDGVVPYRSAHTDFAASEVVVPADHLTVHHHPAAVQEVRRILLEHLRRCSGEEQR
jgi:pimeloyl-ACP methyl ester carboxylesterase